MNKAIITKSWSLSAEKNPVLNINQIDKERLKQVEENRNRLKPIVETVLFLGRQNIAFTGHRDNGTLNLDLVDNSPVNEGNFRELLKYRVRGGDNVLRAHLENSSARANRMSKTTQNELINCCGDEILETIVKRIQDSKLFSLIFNETAGKASGD